jgi:hypothetical protein
MLTQALLDRPERFELGMICATPAAMAALDGDPKRAAALLARHVRGEGGDLCAEDRLANTEAIKLGGQRVLSVYKQLEGETVWIITEADRSVTTILTPDDY